MLTNKSEGQVIVVDDDTNLCNSIAFALSHYNLKIFHTGKSFIDSIKIDGTLLQGIGCILLDIRLTDLSGVNVFEKLLDKFFPFSKKIIFISGHADIELAVNLIKKGAYQVIEKPFDLIKLENVINDSFIKSKDLNEKLQLLNSLSSKEKVVMDYIYSGYFNKDIALILNNSVRTIEIHRQHIFDKLNVKNAIDLTKFLDSI
jgi:two-component system response regulator DctR